jgi:hypothetical protein
MKFLKTTLFLLVFFMPFNMFATAKFECMQSGYWSATATWTMTSGSDADGIPDADDEVTISGKTVTLNSDVSCTYLNVILSSTLDANDIYNIVVSNIFTVGRGSRVINVNNISARSGYFYGNSTVNSYYGGKVVLIEKCITTNSSDMDDVALNIFNCIFEVTESYVATNFYIARIFLGEGSIFRIMETATPVIMGINVFADNIEPRGGFGRIEVLGNNVIMYGQINWRCPVVINGSVNIQRFLSLSLSTSYIDPAYPITGTGKIILEQGGRLASSVGLAPLELKGPSLENYTTLTSLPIIFNGTTPQTLSGPGIIFNVTVDNPNGLTIGNNDTFSIDRLTLINGGLILNNKDLTVNTLIGDSPQRYVQTNGTGHLIRPLIPNGGFNTFPIGTATSYSPITLRSFSTGSVSYKYGANVRNGINPSRPLSGVAGTDFINKEWDINREASVPATAVTVVQIPWQSADENAGLDCNTFRMLHHNGTTWEALPELQTTRDCANRFIRFSNVTSFSPFAIGVANTVLSADLISIKAAPQYKTILINWQTANEQNMLDFGVERSMDGQNFEQIGAVKAHNAPSIYDFKDVKAQDNTPYYYRIAMRENNGKIEYSKVVTATLSGKTKTVSVFPNPAKDVLNISGIDPTDEWQVVDIIGKTRATYKGQQTLDVSNFSNGIYFIKMGNENRSRFVVSK